MKFLEEDFHMPLEITLWLCYLVLMFWLVYHWPFRGIKEIAKKLFGKKEEHK